MKFTEEQLQRLIAAGDIYFASERSLDDLFAFARVAAAVRREAQAATCSTSIVDLGPDPAKGRPAGRPDCPGCRGYGYLPQGACTPDGPEYWVPCACNEEEAAAKEERFDRLMKYSH